MTEQKAWAVQEGSATSDMARLVAWAAVSGNSGIILPGHAKVQALATPGAGVNVMSGSAVIASSYPGHDSEAYLVKNVGYKTLAVSPAPSGSAKTMYVVWQINDWHFDDSSDPGNGGSGDEDKAARKDALYNEIKIVSSLVSMTHSYIPLAKIVLPAGQGTVTNAMITDLRSMAFLQSDPHNISIPAVTEDEGRQLSLVTKSNYGEIFPDISYAIVDIPSYATYVDVHGHWTNVVYPANKNCWGYYWIGFGPATGNGSERARNSQHFKFNTPLIADSMSHDWDFMDRVYIPPELRGTSQPFFLFGRYDSDSTGTGIYMDRWSGVYMQLNFLGYPDPDVVVP